MEWLKHFWKIHGERIVFMGMASIMAIGFIVIGIKVKTLEPLISVGTTILTGTAMLCYNKARGNGKDADKPNIELK